MLIVRGMIESGATIIWVALLLLFMLYTFGIFFAQQVGSPENTPYSGYQRDFAVEFNNYFFKRKDYENVNLW